MSTQPLKSRDVVMRVVIPRLREIKPTGIVSRGELMAELERAGIPMQPWLTAKSSGRGFYDISSYYGESDEAVKAARIPGKYTYEIADEVVDPRTDEQVAEEVSGRFAALDRMAHGVSDGKFRAVVISGPPGVGKTFGVEKILSNAPGLTYERVAGYSRATGLYKLLYEHRESSHVLLIDDCDSIFSDAVSLSLLKSSCDTLSKRHLHWRSEATLEDDLGESVPRHFVYEGRIIFVTNLNFDKLIEAGNASSAHVAAMVSRAFYVDLNMTPRETLSRVLTCASAVLADHNTRERDRMVAYVKENASRMREVSLRALLKLSQVVKATRSDADFVRIANATLLRR